MAENTKQFTLRTILTVTTGRLVTKPKEGDNGIGDLCELLGWMTRDTPFTNQLGRFSEECKPWLIRWFPELQPTLAAGKYLDEWTAKSDSAETAIFYWLAELGLMFPDIKQHYDVPQIPQDDHERKHPYDELVGEKLMHTPGPWKIAKSKMAAGTLMIVAKDIDNTQCQVAMVSFQPGGRDWKATAEANARLIAAVPYLLVACEAMIHAAKLGDPAAGAVAATLAEDAVAKARPELLNPACPETLKNLQD